jgi:hypothetical protein
VPAASRCTNPTQKDDQGGNVWEWNEARLGPQSRGIRGGSFFDESSIDNAIFLHKAFRGGQIATDEGGIAGFRVASIAPTGDFNHDGIVDAADYVVWRKGLGTTYTQDDYNTWRTHFGQATGSGAGATATFAVPEPASVLMLLTGVVASMLTGRSPCDRSGTVCATNVRNAGKD